MCIQNLCQCRHLPLLQVKKTRTTFYFNSIDRIYCALDRVPCFDLGSASDLSVCISRVISNSFQEKYQPRRSRSLLSVTIQAKNLIHRRLK